MSCQSGFKKVKTSEPLSLKSSSAKGSNSEFFYTTESKVEILDQGKKIKAYTEFADFNIQRETLHSNEKGEMQFKITTTDKKGNMDLNDMAFPEPGEILYEMINHYGEPVVVKDHPAGSIFYLPRVALPRTKVNAGDTWKYKGRWISKETGWPFEIEIKSVLKAWADCDGNLCAIIDLEGSVILPGDFPLRSELQSKIKGQLHYAPHSFEILWGESQSKEVFRIKELQKVIKVESHSCSSKIGYSKTCKK